MADRIKGITVEIGGNTTKLQTALKGVNASIRESQNALRDVNKLLKIDPGNTELLKQKQDILNKAITDTKDKLKQEKEALEQLKKSDAAGKNKEQIQALEREIVATTQSLKGLEEQAKQSASVLGSQMQAAGEKIKAVGNNIQNVGQGIAGVGAELTQKVTAPIMAFGGASAAAFNQVDSALDTVAVKTGATGEQLKEFEDIIEDIATNIPVSFDAVGEAVGEVNTRFGLTGAELKRVSTQFAEFADINKVDVTQAVDSVQKAMAAFGLDAKDASAALDTLNAAGQASGISMSDLSNTMVSNSAALHDLGFGFAQSAEFLGKLEKGGIDASAVLAGLKKAEINASADGKTLQEALAGLDAELANSTSSIESMNTVTELFGNKAGVQLASALQNGTLSLSELTDASMALDDNLGSVSDTFKAVHDNDAELVTTMNELTVTMKDIGEVIVSDVKPILEDLKAFITNLRDEWKNLDEGQQQSIITIGAVIAAIGPLLTIIGNLIVFIGQITSAIGTITAAAGSAWTTITAAFEGIAAAAGVAVGTVMAAFALVAAAVVIWIKNWEDIKAMFTDGIPYAVGLLVDKIKDMVNKIGQFFKQLGVNISTTWRTAINNVTNAVGQWKANLIAKCKEIVESIKTTFSGLAKDAKKWGTDLIDGLIQGIKDGVGKVEQTAKDVAAAVAKYIHFSEPDVGPLSNFHTFMPDMIKEMTKGIEANVHMLDAPMAEVANKLVPNNAVELSYSPKLAGQMDSLTNAIGAIRPSDSMRVVLEGDMAQLFKAYKLEENSRVIRYGRA